MLLCKNLSATLERREVLITSGILKHAQTADDAFT
jgi:hypothetical protein